jgi:hypothetical protein
MKCGTATPILLMRTPDAFDAKAARDHGPPSSGWPRCAAPLAFDRYRS